LKRLLLIAVLIGAFTLQGVDAIQLVAAIAFSAGVFSARLFDQRPQSSSASRFTAGASLL
jgi:hypothetical protein